MEPKTSSDLLDPDGLIRRLKKGAPLVLAEETVRLPRFTEIREIDQRDIGGSGKDPLVVARSRTATWALMPWTRRASFGVKEAKSFLELMAALQQQSPQKPVKGYVLTSGSVKPETLDILRENGHLVSGIGE